MGLKKDPATSLAHISELVAHAAEQVDLMPLERAVRDAAAAVRTVAARSHDQVGVRMIRKAGGVRVTVTGPRAQKYRALFSRELEQRMPGAKAEIRAQILRRTR